jgi:hypothetical protein
LKRADAKRQDSHKPEQAQLSVPIVASGRMIRLSVDRENLLGLMQDSSARRSGIERGGA